MPALKIKNPEGKGAIIILDQSDNDFLVCKKDSTETFSIDCNGLPDQTNNQQYHYQNVCVGDVAADSDSLKIPIFQKLEAVTLYKVYYSVADDVGADAVNYQTINLYDKDDNAIFSSPPTTAAGLTGGVANDCGSLDGTHKVLAADEKVYCTFTKASSGMALEGFTLHLVFTCEA